MLTYVELVQQGEEFVKLLGSEHKSTDVPRGLLRWGKMTLDLQDERCVWEVMPKGGMAMKDGCLAHEPFVESAWGNREARVRLSGYCWIKSRRVKGNWHHSRQRLVMTGAETGGGR